tara:strand:- start:692 stop:904 length:213 start_codon:yes stop_codon:yes gene_type:complete
MNKLVNFLIDITITKECMYILIFNIFLLGITGRKNDISKATSLTIGIHRLHFTFIVGLQNNKVLNGHGVS